MKLIRALVAALASSVALSCATGRPPPTAQASAVAATQTIAFTAREGTDLSIDLSPDGRTIAFDLLGQIWLLASEGGEARPLTDAVRHASDDAAPAFGPDGQTIVFLSDRGREPRLRRVPVSGGMQEPLLAGRTKQHSHAWSPDGRTLAFVDRDSIRLLDTVTADVRTLVPTALSNPAVRSISWSRDGERLIFSNASLFSRFGGRVREVSLADGATRPYAGDSLAGLSPVESPDGARLAWIGRDSAGNAQLWVRERDGRKRTITAHEDVARLRVRWTPDGQHLVYSADGRLWRISADGGAPAEIPFEARISFVRVNPPVRETTFPDPGERLRARGFQGLALSPDGARIAMLALGRLWLFAPGDEPQALHDVPHTAGGLAWSPAGDRLVWSAGPGGTEDLFVTDVGTRQIRQLTALRGSEERPSWSPDGKTIAFVHWPGPPENAPPWEYNGWQLRVRTVPADAAAVTSLDEAREVAVIPGFNWGFTTISPLGQETPLWSPSGGELLLTLLESQAMLATTDGQSRTLAPMLPFMSFVRWLPDSTVVFVGENRLWSGRLHPDSGLSRAAPLSDEPALFATAATDGTVLHLSDDGLRLRSPNGAVQRLGWPLGFTAEAAAPPVLVRNARVIDGTAARAPFAADVLIESGRIARVGAPGSVPASRGTRTIDAEGRTMLPGLIDLHAHVWDDQVLPIVLRHGVTTIRDPGSSTARTAALRDAVAAGLIAGPRVVLGGFQFYPQADSGGLSGGITQGPENTGHAARAIRTLAALGGSWVKMRFSQNTASGVMLVRAAREAGLPISSHCAISLPLISAGISGKEHLGPSCGRYNERVYGDVAELLRASGVWVVPTIAAYASGPLLSADTALLGSRSDGPPLTPWLHWWSFRSPPRGWAANALWAADAREATRALFRSGVTIGAGSDVAVPGWLMHVELEELVRAGLSPVQAIASATGLAARILGAEAELGTITPGRRADLILVDGDPTEDIRNTRRIWRIYKDGREVDREALLR